MRLLDALIFMRSPHYLVETLRHVNSSTCVCVGVFVCGCGGMCVGVCERGLAESRATITLIFGFLPHVIQ